MNRLEALHFLGLDEDATPEDIKTAYRETAQILHPDKFAGNKKLQERATEQFKVLQDAYSVLNSETGRKKTGSGGSSKSKGTGSRRGSTRTEDYIGRARTIEAKLAGIAAARTQLVAQRDSALDERRRGIAMLLIGAALALFGLRRPFGILGVVGTIGGAAAVWGIIQIVSAQGQINALEEHLGELAKQKKKLMRELEDLEE